MTDYNDGKWHGWNGGECPVHKYSEIKFMMLNGTTATMWAGEHEWKRDSYHPNPCIAFRVIKPYVEPREFWLVETDGAPLVFTSKDRATLYAEDYGFTAVRVREVLPDDPS